MFGKFANIAKKELGKNNGESLCRDGENALRYCHNSEAFDLFQQAASCGYADAFFYLGECYFYGWGTQVDYAQMAQCYLNALDWDCMAAFLPLAECLINGWGIEQNVEHGKKMLEDARNKGVKEAEQLYYMYFASDRNMDEWQQISADLWSGR